MTRVKSVRRERDDGSGGRFEGGRDERRGFALKGGAAVPYEVVEPRREVRSEGWEREGLGM